MSVVHEKCAKMGHGRNAMSVCVIDVMNTVDKANLKLAQQATSYLKWLNYSQDTLLETLKLLYVSLKCIPISTDYAIVLPI